jgi:hypothetical protein
VQAGSRRIHDHQIWSIEQLGEDCTIPGSTVVTVLSQVPVGRGMKKLRIPG